MLHLRLFTAVDLDLSVAYALVADWVLWGNDAGSDGRLVAVERRDMKHVAVGADPDGFNLAVPRQGSRVGRAARAENLKWEVLMNLLP